jgi:hypothetical protein
MDYKQLLQKDLDFGFQQEDKLLNVFREKFDKHLCKTNDFSIIDYISPKTYLELKSRNKPHNEYPTIMIGENKMRFAEKSNKKVIFVWNFTDGIYYYVFNKDDLTNGNINFAMGGRTDRGKDERKMCAYVKSSILLPI